MVQMWRIHHIVTADRQFSQLNTKTRNNSYSGNDRFSLILKQIPELGNTSPEQSEYTQVSPLA